MVVVFSKGDLKFPMPDGMNSMFFKSKWEVARIQCAKG